MKLDMRKKQEKKETTKSTKKLSPSEKLATAQSTAPCRYGFPFPSVVSPTLGCFKISNFSSKIGLSPRIKRIAYRLSNMRTSSGVISSLPHCQVMNSRKRQPQRKIFVAAVLIGGLKQKNPRLYQGNKNFSIA